MTVVVVEFLLLVVLLPRSVATRESCVCHYHLLRVQVVMCAQEHGPPILSSQPRVIVLDAHHFLRSRYVLVAEERVS